MATLTVQDISNAGLTPSYAAAAGGGDKFEWGPYRYLHVKNGGGSPITATVVSQRAAIPGLAPESLAVVVGAGSEKIIGPFDKDGFRKSDGMVEITYSGVTTVTVGAFNL